MGVLEVVAAGVLVAHVGVPLGVQGEGRPPPLCVRRPVRALVHELRLGPRTPGERCDERQHKDKLDEGRVAICEGNTSTNSGSSCHGDPLLSRMHTELYGTMRRLATPSAPVPDLTRTKYAPAPTAPPPSSRPSHRTDRTPVGNIPLSSLLTRRPLAS